MIIIAGPNGAGKTTLIKSFSLKCRANKLDISIAPNPDDPTKTDLSSIGKQKIMITHIEDCLQKGKSVLFETTGASRSSILREIQEGKNRGYRIYFWYLWLPDTLYAKDRVKWRAKEGGHFVPFNDITRRYNSSMENIFDFIKKSDKSIIIDGSGNGQSRFIAYINNKTLTIKLKDLLIWNKMCVKNPKLKELISKLEVSCGSN